MLKVENLSKKFKKRIIFEKASFSLPGSGLFILHGDNGIGKTTLAKILLGETFFEGSIFIDDKEFNNKNRYKLINETFYIGQTHNYVTFLSGEENSKLSKEIFSLKDDERIAENKYDREMNKLSEGEQMLMSIENAFYTPKKIIILDEVSAFLDDDYFYKIMGKIEQLKRNKLVVFITHDDRLDFTKYKLIEIIDHKILIKYKNVEISSKNETKNSEMTKKSLNFKIKTFFKYIKKNLVFNLLFVLILSFLGSFSTTAFGNLTYDKTRALKQIYEKNDQSLHLNIEPIRNEEIYSDRDELDYFTRKELDEISSNNIKGMNFYYGSIRIDPEEDDDSEVCYFNEKSLENCDHDEKYVTIQILENSYQIPYELVSNNIESSLSLNLLNKSFPKGEELLYGFTNINESKIDNPFSPKYVMKVSPISSYKDKISNIDNIKLDYNEMIVSDSFKDLDINKNFIKTNNKRTNKLLLSNFCNEVIFKKEKILSSKINENSFVISDEMFMDIKKQRSYANKVEIFINEDNNNFKDFTKLICTNKYAIKDKEGFSDDNFYNYLNELINLRQETPGITLLTISSLALLYIFVAIIFAYIKGNRFSNDRKVLLINGFSRADLFTFSFVDIFVVNLLSMVIATLLAPLNISKVGFDFYRYNDFPQYFISFEYLGWMLLALICLSLISYGVSRLQKE